MDPPESSDSQRQAPAGFSRCGSQLFIDVQESKPILILGAGWFGCHCALTLRKLGLPFRIYDRSGEFFQGASSKNQNRLHLGFHYPRSYHTRQECAHGYTEFMKEYSFLTEAFPNNIYAVAKESLIDYTTYLHIFEFESVPYKVVGYPKIPVALERSRFQGDFFIVEERFINPRKAAQYFESELSEYLVPDSSGSFAFTIDCTYGQKEPPAGGYYELCLTLVYKANFEARCAITVMDGSFFSIYPYCTDENLYTLTHVALTPLFTSKNIKQVRSHGEKLTAEDIEKRRAQMEADVERYVPNLRTAFTYDSHFLSIKCKWEGGDADRSLKYTYEEDKKVLQFCCGKITGIFSMQQTLESLFPNMLKLV